MVYLSNLKSELGKKRTISGATLSIERTTARSALMIAAQWRALYWRLHMGMCALHVRVRVRVYVHVRTGAYACACLRVCVCISHVRARVFVCAYSHESTGAPLFTLLHFNVYTEQIRHTCTSIRSVQPRCSCGQFVCMSFGYVLCLLYPIKFSAAMSVCSCNSNSGVCYIVLGSGMERCGAVWYGARLCILVGARAHVGVHR